MSAESIQLLDLPDEILAIIISTLDRQSRAAIHSTSKQLDEVTSALEKNAVAKIVPGIQAKFASEGLRVIPANYQPERCVEIGLKYADIIGIDSLFPHVKEVVDNTKALWAIFDSQNSLVDCRHMSEYSHNIDEALTAIEVPKTNFSATDSWGGNLLHNVRKWFVAPKLVISREDGHYIINRDLVEDLGRIFSKIADSGIDVNQRDSQTAAPIHYAMQCFQIDSFLDILDAHGVDINAQTTKTSAYVDGQRYGPEIYSSLTPLHVATMFCNINAVLKVLELGADPTIKNSADRTTLEMAEIYLAKTQDLYSRGNLLQIVEALTLAEAQAAIAYEILDEVLAEEISSAALSEVALLAAECATLDLAS